MNPDDEAAATGGPGKSDKARKKGSFWRELPILVVTAVVLAVLIQTFLARVYSIPSQSMEQTLHGCDTCTGDRVLVDKLTYNFTDPGPGDVVVFSRPDTWDRGEFSTNRSDNVVVRWLQEAGSLIGLADPSEDDFVKRVIAVSGQTVQCCDAANRVLVDGKPLDETYIYWEPGRGTTQDSFEPIRVPENYLFVMGDNRNDSKDSRYQGGGGVNGLVPVDNVIGKARFIVLPPSRWQGVSDHDPQAVALSAPAWQTGLPLGVGAVAAWPAVLVGRRLRGLVVRPDRRR
nr:signal peptidase I [Goodfellowiella coeruleoviolacea]